MSTPSPPIACATIALPDEAQKRLAAGCRLTLVPATDRDAVLAALAGAEGLLCSAVFPIDSAMLDAVPRLRVISNFGVGYNNVDVKEATRRDIAVCNTPGVLSEAVADLTMSLILSLSRRLFDNAAHVRSGGWSRREAGPPLGFDIEGRTLGIVGFGRIGRAVADRARAFRMRPVFHDVFQDAGDYAAFCHYRPLDDLLRESDIVTLHVNLTPETQHLIGARELALMRPGAYLVNTSRGPVIDQAALVAALRERRIAGAALDVLEVEPPPADEPILALPNVVLLPHIGSATVETRQAMLDLAVENLASVLAGKPPPACVNPDVLERALRRR